MELDRGVYGNSLNVAESHEGGFTIGLPCGLPGFLDLHFLIGVHLQSTAGRRVEAEVTHD